MVKKRKVYIVFMLVYCMGIEKYVGDVRAGLNAGARGLGNMVYDGLGDSLSSDVDVKGLVKKVGVSVLAGGMLVTSIVGGSGVRAEAGDFDDFMHGMIGSYVHESVKRHAQNSMDDYQSEDGGETVAPKPYVEMIEWHDKNGDHKVQKNELGSDIGRSVNPRNHGVNIKLNQPYTYSSDITSYTIFDSNNNSLGVFKLKRNTFAIFKTNDFPSGKYRIEIDRGDIHVFRYFNVTASEDLD